MKRSIGRHLGSRKKAKTSAPRRLNKTRTTRRRRSSKKGSKRRRLAMTGIKSFGPPACKNVSLIEQGVNTLSTRTWGAVNLMKIPFSLTNQRNTRCANQAHVSGVMTAITIRNELTVPVTYYEYWIIPRVYDESTISDALLQKDFYVAHGLVIDEDRSWTPTLASFLYDEPVNPARFTVLKKRITKLAPRVGAAGSYPMGNRLSEYKRKTYIPIGRKYNYGSAVVAGVINDGESANTIESPVFYVSFAVDTMTPDGAPVGTGAVKRELHIVTYFRDGESGM